MSSRPSGFCDSQWLSCVSCCIVESTMGEAQELCIATLLLRSQHHFVMMGGPVEQDKHSLQLPAGQHAFVFPGIVGDARLQEAQLDLHCLAPYTAENGNAPWGKILLQSF